LREAQEFLEEEHKNKSINELDISREKLEGDLDLSEFTKLKKLNCSGNQLTKLKGINKLEHLDCRINFLSDIGLLLPALDVNNLKEL